MAPISLEDQLIPGTLEYAIHYIVEERLDMSGFDARYNNDDTGRKAINPKLLIKIILFGYSMGMISSRSLEKACQKHTTFMAMNCGKTPDHSTIAAFVSSIDLEVEGLFTKILMICQEKGPLETPHFSIDGLQQTLSITNSAKQANFPFQDAARHRRSVDKHKKRYKSKKRYFSVEDFKRDNRTGKLIRPAGHALCVRNRNFKTTDGYKAIAYQAPKTACRACHSKSKCLRKPNTESRQVHIFSNHRPGSVTDAMKRKIDTPEGRCQYSKRIAIVEPVFGNIRSCKKMDRFTSREKSKLNIQWLLYCMIHNIEKVMKYGKTFAPA